MRNYLSGVVLKNTIWQLAGKGVTATTTFLVTIILGKFLGASLYGDFVKTFALVETFYVLVDFGLNAVFVKSAIDKKNEEYFLSQLIFTRLLIALLAIGAVFLVTALLPYNPNSNIGFSGTVKFGIVLASVTILTYATVLTAQAGFQLKLAFHKQLITQIIGSLVKLLLLVLVLLKVPSLLNVILAVVAGEAVMSLSALFLAFEKLKINFDLAKTWVFLKKASPIGFSLIFNLLYFRGDMLILSSIKSSTEVGNYSLAYKFFEVSLVLPIFFVNSVYPSMVKNLKENATAFAKQVSLYSRIILLAAVFVSVAMFFLGPAIINLIFRQGFELSGFFLQILSLGLPFFYLSAIYMWGIITLGAQKILLPIYFAGAVFNLLLNFFFIPALGAQAAALMTVISEGLILLVLYLSYYYFFHKADYVKT